MKHFIKCATVAVVVGGVSACSPSSNLANNVKSEVPGKMGTVEVTEIDVADMPGYVSSVISKERPAFKPVEVLKKVRDGRVYYDVEGQLPNGEEIEFDILDNNGIAEIVEIQRDLNFSELPETVQTLALKTADNTKPARVIESLQTDDSVIYEFFMPDLPKDPAYEIRVQNGQVELLSERWKH